MPFGPYEDFDHCVAENQDKASPEAFCAWLHYKVTGQWPGESQKEKTAMAIRLDNMLCNLFTPAFKTKSQSGSCAVADRPVAAETALELVVKASGGHWGHGGLEGQWGGSSSTGGAGAQYGKCSAEGITAQKARENWDKVNGALTEGLSRSTQSNIMLARPEERIEAKGELVQNLSNRLEGNESFEEMAMRHNPSDVYGTALELHIDGHAEGVVSSDELREIRQTVEAGDADFNQLKGDMLDLE